VRAVPAFVIGLILAEVRFGPHCFQESGKAFIEPHVAQSLQVTRSPNHWWPSSCEIKSSSPVKYSGASLDERGFAGVGVALEFSMPPATKSSTMTCAYFSQG